MNLPFESLNPKSRLWIYQSEHTLTTADQLNISSQLEHFLSTWSSHGNEMFSGYTIKHQRFILVSIDEMVAGASGCSIDKLVHFMQSLGESMQLNLMDRNIAFVKDETVESVKFSEIKYLVNIGAINENTLIFNNAITLKSDLADKWLVKASETWTAKYFKKELV